MSQSKIDEVVAGELLQLQVRSGDVGVAQPDPSNDMRTTPEPLCKGCNGRHRGVNEQLHCLRTQLDIARQLAEERGGQLERTREQLKATRIAQAAFLGGLDKKGRMAMHAAKISSFEDLRRQVRALPMSAHEKNLAGKRPGGD